MNSKQRSDKREVKRPPDPGEKRRGISCQSRGSLTEFILKEAESGCALFLRVYLIARRCKDRQTT